MKKSQFALLTALLIVTSATSATAGGLITGAGIRDGSITGNDIRNNSITDSDIVSNMWDNGVSIPYAVYDTLEPNEYKVIAVACPKTPAGTEKNNAEGSGYSAGLPKDMKVVGVGGGIAMGSAVTETPTVQVQWQRVAGAVGWSQSLTAMKNLTNSKQIVTTGMNCNYAVMS